MRAVAACAVLLYHIGLQQKKYGYWPFLHHFQGSFGVDIFFVVSGFIMMYISRNVDGSLRDGCIFACKRVVRIVPIYWFYTMLLALLLVGAPGVFDNAVFDVWRTVCSFLFIPHIDGAITGVGWTLNYEMYFYGLFAASIVITRHGRYFFLLVFLFCSILIGAWVKSDGLFFMFYTHPLLMEFVFGMTVYRVFQSSWKPSGRSALFVLIGSLLGLCLTMGFVRESILIPYRVFFWGIPAALCLASALYLEANGRKMPPSLVRLGDASYSLYLSHIFVLPLIGKIFVVVRTQVPILENIYAHDLMYITTCIAVCILVAHLSFHFLEKPVHNLLRHRLKLVDITDSHLDARR